MAGPYTLGLGQRWIYLEPKRACTAGPMTYTAPSKTFYLILCLYFLKTFSELDLG